MVLLAMDWARSLQPRTTANRQLSSAVSRISKRFSRARRRTSCLTRLESARRAAGYFRPQNVASGFTSSNPASQASWLRQETSDSALRPVSGWIRRTGLRSGRSAPTTAMQPEWLTSTVTALARSFAPPFSHSTRSFTLDIKHLSLHNLSHLSCTALSTGCVATVTVIVDLALEELLGPGGRLKR